jgi:hypothetical protein
MEMAIETNEPSHESEEKLSKWWMNIEEIGALEIV